MAVKGEKKKAKPKAKKKKSDEIPSLPRREGRPRVFDNCLDLDAMCELYFETMAEGEEKEVYDKKKQEVATITVTKPCTVVGLALFLGFCDRHSLLDYGKEDEFSLIIKKAKSRIEQERNEQLVSGESPPAAAIFDLKCNFKYRETDKDETDDVKVDPVKVVIEVADASRDKV